VIDRTQLADTIGRAQRRHPRAFCGAALSLTGGGAFGGLIAGGIGAVVGTFGFSQLRARLAKAFGGRDLPAALIEAACAIAAAARIVAAP
jgi:uncharacterized membrane protein